MAQTPPARPITGRTPPARCRTAAAGGTHGFRHRAAPSPRAHVCCGTACSRPHSLWNRSGSVESAQAASTLRSRGSVVDHRNRQEVEACPFMPLSSLTSFLHISAHKFFGVLFKDGVDLVE